VRKKKHFVLWGILILLLAASPVIYISYKKYDAEKSVMEYLIDDKHVEKETILSCEPFIANLSGAKNYMVGVTLKDDPKTYYYYKNNARKVILESYTENGAEQVVHE